LLLSSHKSVPNNFSREVIEQNKSGLGRLYNGKKNLEYLMENAIERDVDETDKNILGKGNKYKEDFIKSMEDDINTAGAISSIFELVRYANSSLSQETNKIVIKKIYDILLDRKSTR